MIKAFAPLILLIATSAHADLSIRFDEGAPKDRFTLTNSADCATGAMAVTIDLGTAPAGLIFDTTSQGAGVEVFQPFEVVAGRENLETLPDVADGDAAISLAIVGLAPGASVAFTIDVDDTGGGREITVSGSEIAGASVRLDGAMQQGVFDDRARATLPLPPCAS